MGEHWRPAAGQVALIEPLDAGASRDCFTGLVLPDSEERVLVDLGASPRPASQECEVVASFFAPDALYRVKATASKHGHQDAVIDLAIHEIERVQRRSSPRVQLTLPAVLSNFDGPGDLISVTGETLDIGPGGCRVQTAKPFPQGCDPTVSLKLPDGKTLISLGQVLQVEGGGTSWQYRLVFMDLEDNDAERLAKLVVDDATI